MKGIVFTNFFDMVEETLGFELVDQLINETELSTGGAYTGVGTYSHLELLSLASNLHKITNISLNDLLITYGEYLFPKLVPIAPDIIAKFSSTFELVAAVDSIIHVEVKKLYPDAELPNFEIIKHDHKDMIVTYTSCRPFAYLAYGLILGCAEYFNQEVQVSIKNRQADCLIEISYSDSYALAG
jgi:hypothetical protein